MTDVTAEFFRDLAGRGREPLLGKVKGSLRFDLTHDQKTDRWLVKIDNGDISVSRRNGAADCTVRTNKALFDGIVTGEVNAMTAVLRNAIAVSGDVRLLVLFQRLFPGPRESHGPKHDDALGVSQP
jgi:putative sterol carrier protein